MIKVLDAASGELLLSELPIRPHASAVDIRAVLAGDALLLEDYGRPWKWMRIRDLRVGDDYFVFGFGLENDRLKMVTFALSKTPFGTPSWDDFDEAKEEALVATYDAWLTGQVGTQRDFSWGSVSASFDPRSAGTTIDILYR